MYCVEIVIRTEKSSKTNTSLYLETVGICLKLNRINTFWIKHLEVTMWRCKHSLRLCTQRLWTSVQEYKCCNNKGHTYLGKRACLILRMFLRSIKILIYTPVILHIPSRLEKVAVFYLLIHTTIQLLYITYYIIPI